MTPLRSHPISPNIQGYCCHMAKSSIGMAVKIQIQTSILIFLVTDKHLCISHLTTKMCSCFIFIFHWHNRVLLTVFRDLWMYEHLISQVCLESRIQSINYHRSYYLGNWRLFEFQKKWKDWRRYLDAFKLSISFKNLMLFSQFPEATSPLFFFSIFLELAGLIFILVIFLCISYWKAYFYYEYLSEIFWGQSNIILPSAFTHFAFPVLVLSPTCKALKCLSKLLFFDRRTALHWNVIRFSHLNPLTSIPKSHPLQFSHEFYFGKQNIYGQKKKSATFLRSNATPTQALASTLNGTRSHFLWIIIL